jgi:acetolactate synthase I/II/III large subunit
MSDNQVSDILAQAFAAEGVDTLFTLMGDANMYWSASMADNQKVRLIHARHEHCCVAMADAYARATGRVGVGSVTCGPGYTQIMTALAMATRGNAPIVVFAGDAPIGASWYIQSADRHVRVPPVIRGSITGSGLQCPPFGIVGVTRENIVEDGGR